MVCGLCRGVWGVSAVRGCSVWRYVRVGVCVLVCACWVCACCVCGCVWCGVCLFVWHAENLRVSIQHGPVCAFKTFPCVPATCAHVLNMCACCRYTRGHFERTRGRVECTHGGGEGRRGEEGRGGSSPVLLTKIAHVGLSLDPREVHHRNHEILHNFSLRVGREQHVTDSFNHSLYLTQVFHSSSPEGNVLSGM